VQVDNEEFEGVGEVPDPAVARLLRDSVANGSGGSAEGEVLSSFQGKFFSDKLAPILPVPHGV